VRFKTPLSGETVTHDVIRGSVTFQNETLDDFVLIKSDGYPTYHLAAQVDDHLMQTSHVLRGEEWLPSAPRHVLIYEAFGWEPPSFAHLSRILGPDRAKLSKRHGAHAALEYRDQGYLPDAVVNFLALLGWSLDDHTEIIDRQTLMQHFDLDRVLPNPAVFNAEKLAWMNGIYIRELPGEELAEMTAPFLEGALGIGIDRGLLLRIIPLVRERIRTLSEIVSMADFFFIEGELRYEREALLGKKFVDDAAGAARALARVVEAIAGLQPWEHEHLEAAIRPIAEELGVKSGELFGVIRVAVTGKTATPPLFETMSVLGRERTLERVKSALDRLREDWA
jgi:glutamyl-tRNA synthetase